MSKKLKWTIISFIALLSSIIFTYLYFFNREEIKNSCQKIEATVITVLWNEDIEVEYEFNEKKMTANLGYYSDKLDLTDKIDICIDENGNMTKELKEVIKNTPNNEYGFISIISLIILLPSLIKTINLFRRK